MKRRTLLRWGFAAGVVLLLGSAVLALGQGGDSPPARNETVAGSITLYVYPFADSWVNALAPDTNYGSQASLSVGSDECEATEYPQRGRALFRFLFGPADYPGMVIQSASVEAYVRRSTDSPPLDISLHRITAPWSEGRVTWNNQPGHTAAVVTTTVSSVIGGLRRTWDITGMARQWHDGKYSNYGFKLVSADESACNLRAFDAKEGVYEARLVVVFVAPTPTPTATPTFTPRPTNTPGPSPTWVAGAAPRIFLPILMR